MSEERRRVTRGRGRRAGNSGTRQAILEEALSQFAEHGFGGTSIRSVATAARVDPSLVTHFFGTKEGLFAASLDVLDFLPSRLVEEIRSGRGGLGRRIATAYLGAWEDPRSGPQLRAVVRAASESQTAAAIVRSSLETKVLSEAARALPQASFKKLQFALSQLLGTAVARYVLGVLPLADLPLAEVIDLLEPALEATLSPPALQLGHGECVKRSQD